MGIWSEVANLGFAIFFGVFALVGIRQGIRAYWPVHRQRLESQANKAEAEAALAMATVENQRDLINLTDRNTQMHSANTQALGQMAKVAGDTNDSIRAIYRHLLSGCECDADQQIGPSKIVSQ